MSPRGPQAVAGDLFGVIRRDQWDLKEHSGVADCVRHGLFGHRVAVDVGEERKVPVEPPGCRPACWEQPRQEEELVPQSVYRAPPRARPGANTAVGA